MKKLFIIAGSNGSGKTTASYTILPEMLNCKEFVNADEIAKGLSPFQPESVAIQAGRLMLKRIDALLLSGKDFAFETTLSTRHFVNTIKEARKKGYYVTVLYLWLNSYKLAIERVKIRVEEGGHNIPEEVIKRISGDEEELLRYAMRWVRKKLFSAGCPACGNKCDTEK